MKYRSLGKTKLKASVIGLGTFPFDSRIWGDISEKKAVEITIRAYEMGINYFNSAFYYGEGNCERLLGKALQSMNRAKVIVATKVGTGPNGFFSLSREHIKKSIKGILKRLQTDYVDVLLLHWPDGKVPLEESIKSMMELKDKGFIRHIGLSAYPIEKIKHTMKLAPIQVLEFYYSMLTRDQGEKILNFAKKNKIGTTPFKVIERGILTDRFNPKRRHVAAFTKGYEPKLINEENIGKTTKVVEALKEVSSKKEIALAQLAISWVLNKREVSSALIGVRSCNELNEDLEAVDVTYNESELKEIESIISKYEFAGE